MTSAISTRSSSADLPSTSPAAVVQVFGARPFQTDGTLLAMAFAAEGGLWSVDEPGVLRHWDNSGRQLSWRPLGVPAILWEFSRGARLLAAASDDVTVWDVASGEPHAVLPCQSWITALAFSPDASFLAVGQDNGVIGIWHAGERRLVREWQAHHSPVSALAFSAEGTALASAGEERTICLWNTDDAQLTGTLLGHTDRIPALVWQPGGQKLYSAGWDTTVRVWDTTVCEPLLST